MLRCSQGLDPDLAGAELEQAMLRLLVASALTVLVHAAPIAHGAEAAILAKSLDLKKKIQHRKKKPFCKSEEEIRAG